MNNSRCPSVHWKMLTKHNAVFTQEKILTFPWKRRSRISEIGMMKLLRGFDQDHRSGICNIRLLKQSLLKDPEYEHMFSIGSSKLQVPFYYFPPNL